MRSSASPGISRPTGAEVAAPTADHAVGVLVPGRWPSCRGARRARSAMAISTAIPSAHALRWPSPKLSGVPSVSLSGNKLQRRGPNLRGRALTRRRRRRDQRLQLCHLRLLVVCHPRKTSSRTFAHAEARPTPASRHDGQGRGFTKGLNEDGAAADAEGEEGDVDGEEPGGGLRGRHAVEGGEEGVHDLLSRAWVGGTEGCIRLHRDRRAVAEGEELPGVRCAHWSLPCQMRLLGRRTVGAGAPSVKSRGWGREEKGLD